ncbi:stage II sporulation protein D [Paenibacillus phoenicis]|uniref:stage II sporulation protein D n=2 Tax=Paenibacillus phoenicis TaxID=554117 RepID=UPI0039EE0788
MQERSQAVKINVAPRREVKQNQEESSNLQIDNKAAISPLGHDEAKTTTVSAPVSMMKVRPKSEQAVELKQERGQGGVAKQGSGGSERPADAEYARAGIEGARGVPLAAQPLRAVPPETRVRVSVRTRPGRTISRLGRRWFGGTGAAPVAAALIALALLLPALIAWRTAQAPAVRHDPAAAQTPSAAVPPTAEPRPQDAARAEAPPAQPDAADAAAAGGPPVRVYLTRTGVVETVPLEQYVTGVLAAEMPADFELAALKAQAIAARTFIVQRLAAGEPSGTGSKDADVNDTIEHQVYLPRAELEEWPSRGKGAELEKLRQAVRQTAGIVMTFRGQPITASFFSSSGGYTENSEEYWSLKIPYLRSVPSPWDAAINPNNRETVEMPLTQLYAKLGQKVPEPVQTALAALDQGEAQAKAAASKLSADKLFKILSWTTGRRVKEIRIGDKVYTGREVREKLDLRSSQFTLAVAGDTVKITTYGYGHGVGMSQWGANGMAKEGYTTTQILKHYYTGISFQQVSHFLK